MEKQYKNYLSTIYKGCHLNQCHHCGNVWICCSYIRCPCCNSGNIVLVPITEHPLFSFDWLETHGFPYLKKLLEVKDKMLSEEEIRNLIKMQHEHLEQVFDLNTRQRMQDFINGLECVLNE